jgi:5-methylcytosine-specific restriction endonuclease McrA
MFQMVQDEQLLKDCNTQVIIEKSSTAKVLEYLIEIDNRKLWIKEGYASMYDFCIRYLGYSEGEANRRIQAARLSQRVEVVKPLLEKGEISLTEEIKALLEEARKLASEKNNTLLLKKVLKAFVKTKAHKTARTPHSKHTRRVPAPTAREVKLKAGHQCEYVSPAGIRCSQTAHLEVDHVRPYSFGGSSKDIENLRLLCKVHNLYMARLYFPKARRVEGEGKGYRKEAG